MTCALIFSEIDRFSSSRAKGLSDMSSLWAAAQNKITFEQGERWRQTLSECRTEVSHAKLSEAVPAMADYLTRDSDAAARAGGGGGGGGGGGDGGGGGGGGGGNQSEVIRLLRGGASGGVGDGGIGGVGTVSFGDADKAAAVEAALEPGHGGGEFGGGAGGGGYGYGSGGGGGGGGGVGGGGSDGFAGGWGGSGSSESSRVENV